MTKTLPNTPCHNIPQYTILKFKKSHLGKLHSEKNNFQKKVLVWPKASRYVMYCKNSYTQVLLYVLHILFSFCAHSVPNLCMYVLYSKKREALQQILESDYIHCVLNKGTQKVFLYMRLTITLYYSKNISFGIKVNRHRLIFWPFKAICRV